MLGEKKKKREETIKSSGGTWNLVFKDEKGIPALPLRGCVTLGYSLPSSESCLLCRWLRNGKVYCLPQ